IPELQDDRPAGTAAVHGSPCDSRDHRADRNASQVGACDSGVRVSRVGIHRDGDRALQTSRVSCGWARTAECTEHGINHRARRAPRETSALVTTEHTEGKENLIMKKEKYRLCELRGLCGLFVFALCMLSGHAASAQDGQALYRDHCASCH